MSGTHRPLLGLKDASQALSYLYGGVHGPAGAVLRAEQISAADLPHPAAQLLGHDHHMTVALSEHYGEPVRLKVLTERLEADQYAREILLRLPGSERVVEYGIVRIDLELMPAAVVRAIREQSTPLGEILIQHDVLRNIEILWFLRFPDDSPLTRHFDSVEVGVLYGRIGVIHCNHLPAIELLEVVRAAPA